MSKSPKSDDEDAPHSRWELLNKPFTLWLLSAFVLSALPFFYTKCDADRKVEAQNIATADKFDLIVGVRLAVATQRLSDYRKQSTDFRNIDARKMELTDIAKELLNGSPATNVYPEFEKASFVGLVMQGATLRRPYTWVMPYFPELIGYESRIAASTKPEDVDQLSTQLSEWVKNNVKMLAEQRNEESGF